MIRQRVEETGLPIAIASLTGGQDELVFDGGSFLMNRNGDVVAELPAFDDARWRCSIMSDNDWQASRHPDTAVDRGRRISGAVYRRARHVGKNGFKGVLLGLSGGIDSALTLTIAVDALGAERVHAVMMPSRYTADISVTDSREMIGILGCQYSEILIRPVFDSFLTALQDEFAGLPVDTTEENIQAQVRGTLLMALSNKSGRVVLTTGNKSEMTVGYATLYGDMAGGFAVLKDVAKTLVYRLSNYRNSLGW